MDLRFLGRLGVWSRRWMVSGRKDRCSVPAGTEGVSRSLRGSSGSVPLVLCLLESPGAEIASGTRF